MRHHILEIELLDSQPHHQNIVPRLLSALERVSNVIKISLALHARLRFLQHGHIFNTIPGHFPPFQTSYPLKKKSS
jgi:hypothetical protein